MMTPILRLLRFRVEKLFNSGAFRGRAPLLIALATAILFNFPALRGRSNAAGYTFTGDVLGFYWPSLYKICNLISRGHFVAIDFSHFNGSADFFLTPNLYSVYPVFVLYSLASAFFKVGANDIQRVLAWTIAYNLFLATHFAIRLAVRFLRWDLWQASLSGIFFGCSVYFVSTLGEPPYVFCAATVPWIAYAALDFAESRSKTSLVLATVPVVFALLGGYLPLGLSAVAFGLMVAVFTLWLYGDGTQIFRRCVLISLPSIIGMIVVSPFLAESYRFLRDSPSAERPNLFYSAHQLADVPQAILRVFSFHYAVPGPFTEMSASIGLIGIMILLLFFSRKNVSENFEQKEIHAILICIGVYSFFVLITYGQFSPLSDAFHYFVPQLGSMHIYQRFLMMSHFFLATALAIILNGLTRSHQPRNARTALFITAISLFGIALMVARFPETAGAIGFSGYTVYELLGLLLFLAFYRAGHRIAVFLCAIVMMNLTALDVMYDWSLESNNQRNRAIQNPVALNETLQAQIVQFMQHNCKKSVVKYVDLSPMWSASGVAPFPKSFSYWVEDQIALSSYHGFNFYLSTRRDYMSLMPVLGTSYTLRPNWLWLETTGADFAILDTAALDNGAIPDNLRIADTETRFSIPNNLVVVPLRQSFIESADLCFDNGVFRAYRAGAVGGSNSRLGASSTNLALNKPTRESSKWGASASFAANRAVDGNTNGDIAAGSLFHTQPEKSPWFEVDLGAEEALGTVRIWNRTDCCQERLTDYWVLLADKPFAQNATAAELFQNPRIWRKHVIASAIPSIMISMDGARGRYLRVQADAARGLRILQFAELEAFRPRIESPVTAVSGSPVCRAAGAGNFANEYSIILENEHPTTVEYLMSYNPRLHFFVNGRETIPAYGPGRLAKFELRPGKNEVRVSYKNVLLSLFWIFYAAYGVVAALAVAWTIRESVRPSFPIE